jgi:hypothetical protein
MVAVLTTRPSPSLRSLAVIVNIGAATLPNGEHYSFSPHLRTLMGLRWGTRVGEGGKTHLR